MITRKLKHTGHDVSALSFGASSLGGVFRETDDKESVRTVNCALDAGLNLIDVSPFYGLTRAESVLGQALKDIDRDRYLLSTKCGRYDAEEFDFSAERVTKSIDESLARLNVDHVDILFCHDIEFVSLEQIWEETLPALQKIKDSGKTRYIGISGLPMKIFREVIGRAPEMVDCILSYCHYELNDTALLDLVPFLDEHKVDLISASPTGMGILTERGAPDWHPAPKEVIDTCTKAVQWCKDQGGDIGKLAIQFACANPDIPTTLVSSANPDRIVQNAKYLDEPIDQDLLKGVQEILAPIHNISWESGLTENN